MTGHDLRLKEFEIICPGPRIGRFDSGMFDMDKSAVAKGGKIEGHSVPLAALGGFLLIVGFFSFNGGSLLSIVGKGEGMMNE